MYKYTDNKMTRLQRIPTCFSSQYHYHHHNQQTMTSPSQISPPSSPINKDECQLGIRSVGTLLRDQYQRATEHAAMLVEAMQVFELNLPTIVPLFGRRSPTRGTMTSISLIHPDIELQRIGGTAEELDEEQQWAY